ncbi:hypothetical protein PENCOP_c004G06906 [Penicillium coprophilum]|uniref:Uncharacterized protein n=1 Tax=Penicillium coprophilum TaxID=36646 RepID=A0A1V6UUT1_9EURO|nr:hypothetical protein PENCOP_c004G06906 [Penicillium coprophilum]
MRPARGGGIDIARTPDGTVWNDLPFLATDTTECWINSYAEMDSKQRLNAASFLAKLASTRIANDQLCQIALAIFRTTFESERPLGSSSNPDDENNHRTFLPIASTLGRGGSSFVQSELGQRAPGGFSPWRWLYWLKRLHQIADEASKADENFLAEEAAKAIEIMLGHVKERNSQILKVFEAAGDAVTQGKDLMGLKKKW